MDETRFYMNFEIIVTIKSLDVENVTNIFRNTFKILFKNRDYKSPLNIIEHSYVFDTESASFSLLTNVFDRTNFFEFLYNKTQLENICDKISQMLSVVLFDEESFNITTKSVQVRSESFSIVSEKDECKICLLEKKSITFLKCLHFGVCTKCYMKLGNCCPFCRLKTMGTLKKLDNCFDV